MIWFDPLSLTLICVDVLRLLPWYVSHDQAVDCVGFDGSTVVFVDIADAAFVEVVAVAPLEGAPVTAAETPDTAGSIAEHIIVARVLALDAHLMGRDPD